MPPRRAVWHGDSGKRTIKIFHVIRVLKSPAGSVGGTRRLGDFGRRGGVNYMYQTYEENEGYELNTTQAIRWVPLVRNYFVTFVLFVLLVH